MRRLLLFVHYDRDGLVDEHIVYLLNGLKPFRTECAVLVNGALSDVGAAQISSVADRVICRPNRGFDFGAWAEGLQEYGDRLDKDFDSVLLVNCGCFGPLFPLQEMFDRMEKTDCDFWGITENCGSPGIPPHLQSYFIEIRKPMLLSPEFKKFFREVGTKCVSFEDAVRHGEIGFSSAMTRAGFRYCAYIPADELRQTCVERFGGLLPYCCTPFLIRYYRLPFLKVKAFNRVPGNAVLSGADIFRALLKSGSCYPPQLITNFLRRTAPLSRQKNCPETLLAVDRKTEPEAVVQQKFGVMFHCDFPEKVDLLLLLLHNLPMDFDLLVTSSLTETEDILRSKTAGLKRMRNFRFRQMADSGKGITSWLTVLPIEEHLKYDVMLKLHIAPSPQVPDIFSDEWCQSILDNLAGSPALTSAVLTSFAKEPQLGVVFTPLIPEEILQRHVAGGKILEEADARKKLLQEIGANPPEETGMPVFSPGAMFYYRPRAVENLLRRASETDFPNRLPGECSLNDNAIAQIVPYTAQANGFYFRHCIHNDALVEFFRTCEDWNIYHVPTLRQVLPVFLRALKTSLIYRLSLLFRRK